MATISALSLPWLPTFGSIPRAIKNFAASSWSKRGRYDRIFTHFFLFNDFTTLFWTTSKNSFDQRWLIMVVNRIDIGSVFHEQSNHTYVSYNMKVGNSFFVWYNFVRTILNMCFPTGTPTIRGNFDQCGISIWICVICVCSTCNKKLHDSFISYKWAQ